MNLDTLSLLSDAHVDALRPPGMVPNPEAAARYVSAVSDGGWHAVPRVRADSAAVHGHRHVVAICGAQAQIKTLQHSGTYDRMAWPFEYRLCHACAWFIAIATNSVEREIKILTPGDADAAQLARHGVDSLLAVKVARAILSSEDITAGSDDIDMEAVTLLAHVTRHAPSLAIERDCAEGDCGHDEDDGGCPGGEPACWGCSLVTGEWAGADFEGQLIRQCHVKPPCSVLAALAKAYGITAAVSPMQAAMTGGRVTIDA
jgi:hypothetical protein